MGERPQAAVLLSGGLDSATVLAVAAAQGFECVALTFRYGQRHAVEVDAARAVAAARGVRSHLVLDIDLRAIGGSALTADVAVPKERDAAATAREIPITYVPARNTIFLSYALALAETRGAQDIFIGVNAVDYSGYPDCRPEFIAAFERMAALATRAGVEGAPVRIHAPLIELPKAEIIRLGLSYGVDFGLTRSCYDPDAAGRACGRCDSCRLRLAAFAAVGVADPAPYAPR
ncbi:MAG: 7-cyano-7-deazaguanine synthase QueC [Phycisphaerae bacterium]|jgi:7-cyano-7-deazaguanine synthase